MEGLLCLSPVPSGILTATVHAIKALVPFTVWSRMAPLYGPRKERGGWIRMCPGKMGGMRIVRG